MTNAKVNATLCAAVLAACNPAVPNERGIDAGGACGACGSGELCSATGACIPQGSCNVDQDCMAGMTCGTDGTCSGCGGTHLDVAPVAPDLIFAIDRSCSMTDLIDGSTTKWEAAIAAVQHVIASYGSAIRWGATFFPDTTGDACTQDAIPFPIGDDNGAAISSALEAALSESNPLFPDNPCVTNIDTGLEQAAADPALADSSRDRYVMLMTDGGQSGCSTGGGIPGAQTAVEQLLATGVKTFVIGFGADADPTTLTTLSAAGGEALTGSATNYYEAATATSLDAAFQTIAQQVVSCQFSVDPAPTDLDETWVYFGGTELVPRDTTHMNGWDYSTTSGLLTLYGTDCTRVQTLMVTQIDVIFGCASPPIQ